MLKFVSNFFDFLEEIKINILNILFPPVCGICGKVNKNWLCDECENKIKDIEKFELISKKEEIYKLLDYEKIYFDEILYCFEYRKIIRKLLLQYKFFNKSYLCNFFSNVILKNKKINEFCEGYDIIIPVPMDKIKKIERGYNQTELITKPISKTLGILNDIKVLFKIKQTKTQSTLNKEERKLNVKNVYLVNNKKDIKNKRVILFDDIYTTGATVNEISKKLKEAGAKEILVLVIAKD